MKKVDVKRVAAVGAFAAAAITLLAASAASTAAPARIARTHAAHGSNITIGLPGIPPVFSSATITCPALIFPSSVFIGIHPTRSAWSFCSESMNGMSAIVAGRRAILMRL